MEPGAAVPAVKEMVLLGAGHAHVGVLRAFGVKPEPGLRLTLSDPRRGQLCGFILAGSLMRPVRAAAISPGVSTTVTPLRSSASRFGA